MTNANPEDQVKSSLVWFALGMIVVGVVGTIGIIGWLRSEVVEIAKQPTTIATLRSDDKFVADIARVLEKDIKMPASAGLPSGTIIAWDPVLRDVKGEVTGETREVPQGWKICDGTNSTPSLSGRFLRGVGAPAEAGRPTGSLRQNPTQFRSTGAIGETKKARTDDLGEGSGKFPAIGHYHDFELPAFGVVFLCKV